MSAIDRPRSAKVLSEMGPGPLSSSLFHLAVVALLAWGAGPPALSAQVDSTAAAEDTAEDPDRPTSKSGFDIPTMGGPSSVGRELEDEDKVGEYRFTILHDALVPWFDWKKGLHEKHGLSLGLNATLLGQYGDGTTGDRETAGGGIYRVQAAWNAVGRGGGAPARSTCASSTARGSDRSGLRA